MNNANVTQNSKNIAEVTFFPEKDTIRIKIKGKIYNNETNEYVENSKTLPIDDPIWNLVFGGNRGTKRFLKTNKIIKKTIALNILGYENCDLRVS